MVIKKCVQCGKKQEVGIYNFDEYNWRCDECKKKTAVRRISLLMVLALCILLLPLVSSQLIFKQSDITDLKVQCIINGTFCSNSAQCNLTLYYPNNSIYFNNHPMTNQYSFYNSTLTYTSTIGIYPCSVTCCDVGYCGTSQDCTFEITPDGTVLSVAQAIAYVLGMVLAFVLFLLLLYASIKIPFKNGRDQEGKIISVNQSKWFKVGAICLSYISLMFILGLATAISRNFLYTVGVTKYFEWLYIIMLSMAFPLTILALVIGFAVFINDYVVKKKLKRRHYR